MMCKDKSFALQYSITTRMVLFHGDFSGLKLALNSGLSAVWRRRERHQTERSTVP